MLAQSVDAAAAFGSLQLVTHQIITTRGGTDTLREISAHLTPSKVSAHAVTFAGQTNVEVTVTADGRPVVSHETIDGPIQMEQRAGTWRVRHFNLDGKPMTYYPQGFVQVRSGIHLAVAFVLDYAGATSVLVGVFARSRNINATLQEVGLATTSAQYTGRGFFAHGVEPGFLGFPATSGRPRLLTAKFRTSSGQQANFSMSLRGTAA
jgi:hypothetical protein